MLANFTVGKHMSWSTISIPHLGSREEITNVFGLSE